MKRFFGSFGMRIIVCVSFVTLLSTGQELQKTGLPDYFNDPLVQKVLQEQKTYEYLQELTKFGPRMNGSAGQYAAIQWAKSKLESFGCDKVYLQEVMVPQWRRGPVECAVMTTHKQKYRPLTISAFGGSVGTPKGGVTAEVIEATDLDNLETLGEKVRGKIVFFNVLMDIKEVDLLTAYYKVSRVRIRGATNAARYGAVGMVLRSLTTKYDNAAHVGTLWYYDSTVAAIPAAALGWQDAEYLHNQLQKSKKVKMTMRLSCSILPQVKSYNVIGEITGVENPNEIILIGSHLDSWDKGDAVQDAGVGCCQALEAIYQFKSMEIAPKRTIRCVLFTDEEMWQMGARTYAAASKAAQENHLIAIESDLGAGVLRGITIEADSAIVVKIRDMVQPAFREYIRIIKGYSANDVTFIENALARTDNIGDDCEYFDMHHSDNDNLASIRPRSLAQNTASSLFFLYLMDHYWK
ncbi:MAG: M28 family peptidase [Chitinivibrionales bacterium]|nr:M28 family peptidase [Chitinivibrionales bacterium]